MKKKILLLILIFFTANIYSQEAKKERQFVDEHIFSFDVSLFLKDADTNGFGFGVSYEQMIFNFWSVKGNFSHNQFWTRNEGCVVTTESVSLSTFFYPFFKKFNYLYFGGGCSTDFIQYLSADDNTIINLFPQIGWKQNIKDIVFLDIYYRYYFPISYNQISSYEELIMKKKNGFGLAIKFNFSKLFK